VAAEVRCLAEVRLWERRVGAVAELQDGQVIFEYDPAFRRSGLEISPVHLPLTARGPQTFGELARLEAFQGLPGVLADALPDRFGNAIIAKYFARRGQPDDAMSPVQKLLYVGDRAMGALSFRPALEEWGYLEAEALELGLLVEQARKVISGQVEIVLPEIMQLGASAGGARAKAIILYNRGTNEVRSAFAPPRPGDEHWLIKFDGVGELDAPDPEPQPYNRVEFAYNRMAREAGLDLPRVELLRERGLAHFLTRRFDRQGQRRLHMHTLGGMEHMDYNQPGLFSYEQFMRLVLGLGLGAPALEQAFLRVCFNILAVNQDDHVKNIGFLMDEQGRWFLSPAYDLTFARGRGYTRQHQMSLAGKRDGFEAADLLGLAASFDLGRRGRELIQQVGAALERWPEEAEAAGVPRDRVEQIGGEMRMDCVP